MCFGAGGNDLRISNSRTGAIQNGSGNSAIVGLSSSRYSRECKEKSKGKKPQQGQIESHFPPKAPITEQTPCAGAGISTNRSLFSRTIEIRAARHIPGKNGDGDRLCNRFQRPVTYYPFINPG
jgi:hypothetical protein